MFAAETLIKDFRLTATPIFTNQLFNWLNVTLLTSQTSLPAACLFSVLPMNRCFPA